MAENNTTNLSLDELDSRDSLGYLGYLKVQKTLIEILTYYP